jgi:hypothetical protein
MEVDGSSGYAKFTRSSHDGSKYRHRGFLEEQVPFGECDSLPCPSSNLELEKTDITSICL